MEQIPKDPQADPPAKPKAGTGSVYIGPDRYTTIGKAALNVSNHIGTGRIITAGEMAQYLVDNYLDVAWRAFAEDESIKLKEPTSQGD